MLSTCYLLFCLTGAEDSTPAPLHPPLRSEKSGKKRHKSDTDECNTATGHELLHALGLRAGVIVTVTFHEVDSSPNAKTCTKCNYKSLQYGDYDVEKMSVSQIICVILIVVGIVGLKILTKD